MGRLEFAESLQHVRINYGNETSIAWANVAGYTPSTSML
jgi:hypothetical protein